MVDKGVIRHVHAILRSHVKDITNENAYIRFLGNDQSVVNELNKLEKKKNSVEISYQTRCILKALNEVVVELRKEYQEDEIYRALIWLGESLKNEDEDEST